MNKDQLKRKAKQLKGEVEQQWSKNIDDDLAQIAGQRDVFEENIESNLSTKCSSNNRKFRRKNIV